MNQVLNGYRMTFDASGTVIDISVRRNSRYFPFAHDEQQNACMPGCFPAFTVVRLFLAGKPPRRDKILISIWHTTGATYAFAGSLGRNGQLENA
jgi:hypothetical protein